MNNLQDKETGRITSVRENIVEVNFSGKKPFRHEILTLANDSSVKLEVYTSGGEDTIYALALSGHNLLYRGAKVLATGQVITVPVGEAVKGRLINLFGEQLDGRKLNAPIRRSIYKDSPAFPELFVPKEILQTGIKVIDFFTPVRRGGRIGVFGGSGVGKTVTLLELIHNVEFLKETAVVY